MKTARGAKVLAIGLLISGMLFTNTMVAHDLIMSASMAPSTGTTITTYETTLSGSFWNSGCGLGGTIDIDVPSGDISNQTSSCANGTTTWSATWSNYESGDWTVKASFVTYHGGNDGHKFMHYGEVSALYHVVLPTGCDLPDAPAIANHYMHNDLGIRSRDVYNTIIPAVAHAMNNGEFGPNACSPEYAALVMQFVDAHLPN
jgi:hypothetical protein